MDQASVFNQFVSVKCCPFNILLCYITQSPMACSAEHSFSPCVPQAKRIVVRCPDVRFSDPAAFLSGKHGVCLASLCRSRLLCLKGDGLGQKEKKKYTQKVALAKNILTFDLQGQQWVPSVGLWRQTKAQALGSLQ